MISKTEGICLNYIKYKESSIIARFFTLDRGFQSYVVNSVRSSRSKKKLGFFEPFNVLELVFYESKNSDLHRLSEYKVKRAHSDVRFNIRKGTISLFLSEFLYRILNADQSSSEEIYHFITYAIQRLEELDRNFENFHLQFLLKFTRYLGFGYDPDTMHLPGNSLVIDEIANQLVTADFGQELQASGKLRFEVIEALLKYYRTHTGHALEIKSLDVLHQVFS